MSTLRLDGAALCKVDGIRIIYVDGIYLRRNWGGEFENVAILVAILVAIAVNKDGYREVFGVVEGMKEDKASWGLISFSGSAVVVWMGLNW